MANTAGTLAAIIGTVGAGFFVELVGSFRGFLLLTSVLYFLAALFYCLYSTGERVNFDDPGEYKCTHTYMFYIMLLLCLKNALHRFPFHVVIVVWSCSFIYC